MKTIAYTAQVEGKLWYNRGTNKRTAKVLIHQRRSNDQEGISFMDATSDSTTPTKPCSKCDNPYPATTEYYPPSKRGKYGVHSICRNCKKKHDAERWSDPVVQARMKEKHKIWVANNRVTVAATQRRYYELNADEINERLRVANAAKAPQDRPSQKYRRTHPDRTRESQYKWRRNNPEKWHVVLSKSHRKRRALARGAEGSFTNADLQQKFEQQKGLCWWCGEAISGQFHPDHVVPLSRGGTNDLSNIVIACIPCNLHKHNKLPQEWNGRLL